MSESDELRRRYRYRELILRGKLRLPLDAARRLIGPDCAYHLYRSVASGKEQDGCENVPDEAEHDR